MATAPAFDLLPEFQAGSSPLLISIPHAGTVLAPGLAQRFTAQASQLPDTDWFVDRLYEFARSMSASMLIAKAARLVVDLNRPSDDQPLYSASQTRLMTGVLPMQCFSGEAVYRSGEEPTAAETAERLTHYWQPYHRLLKDSLQSIRQQHGHAILLDAHSIRSEVPMLFTGQLPDLNLGSNGGISTHPALLKAATESLRNGSYSLVVDGRFKGGHITRHYGQPDQQVHALQLEIAQRAYMNESPASWDQSRAFALQQHLQRFLSRLVEWKPQHG